MSKIDCSKVLNYVSETNESLINKLNWILEKENIHDVDKIVGSYVASFMKRGFSQKDIGCLMVQAFTLPLEEIEKRIEYIINSTIVLDVAYSVLCIML